MLDSCFHQGNKCEFSSLDLLDNIVISALKKDMLVNPWKERSSETSISVQPFIFVSLINNVNSIDNSIAIIIINVE